ncbi:uncharacterized protein J3R85_000500 [Psidium guajava]|nr:uncharacterized protein J3R85_000500 [Psidium guajava]
MKKAETTPAHGKDGEDNTGKRAKKAKTAHDNDEISKTETTKAKPTDEQGKDGAKEPEPRVICLQEWLDSRSRGKRARCIRQDSTLVLSHQFGRSARSAAPCFDQTTVRRRSRCNGLQRLQRRRRMLNFGGRKQYGSEPVLVCVPLELPLISIDFCQE